MVERDNEEIAVARQCELLELSRSSYYYSSTRDNEYNLELMRLLDEQYTKVPFYGVKRLTAWLRAQVHRLNYKRVRRLVRRPSIPVKGEAALLPGTTFTLICFFQSMGRYTFMSTG